VNAVTKAAAVPGLRAGFAVVSDPDIRESLWRSRQPWSLSVPAEKAMAAVFALPDLADRVAEACAGEREVLRNGFSALGFAVCPSAVNFLLFRKKSGDPADYQEKLRCQGILIRSCANFSGLDERYYRIAVKTRD
jgi:threonine-phosphate decarboxylase